MSVWFSPFDLEPSLQERLRRCGWMPCEPDQPLPEDAVVLYAPPDQLLAAGSLDPEAILEGYQQLLGLEHPHRLISTWRLAALTDAAIQDGPELNAAGDLQPPQPEPLTAVVTRLALDALPALLEAYLDLELEADLLGGEPDAHYRRRLLADLSVDELLQAWRAPSVLQQELSEAREEAELTLLQLHQVQEELEHYFLQSREQAKQLEEGQQQHEQALQALEAEKSAAIARAEVLQQQLVDAQQQREQAFQSLEAEKTSAEQRTEALQQELSEAREEAELTLLQLHQVQEELEHYFLQSREQAKQLEEGQQQHEQALQALEAEKSAAIARAEVLQQHLVDAQQQREQAFQSLEAEKTSAEQRTEALQQELSEAREEAELTLLQLHQVQEELEHYFLLSRGQVQQLERYDALLRRSEGLLSAAAR